MKEKILVPRVTVTDYGLCRCSGFGRTKTEPNPINTDACTAIAGAVFSGSVDEHIRAYSTADGKIIWDYDTVCDYQTVKGVPGKAGALDVGGARDSRWNTFVNSVMNNGCVARKRAAGIFSLWEIVLSRRGASDFT